MSGLRPLKKTYVCTICNEEGKTLASVRRHYRANHWKQDRCTKCSKTFLHPDNHAVRKHINYLYKCSLCSTRFVNENDLKTHYTSTHPIPSNNLFKEIESAFNRRIITFQHEFEYMEIKNLETANLKIQSSAAALVKRQLLLKKMLRFSIIYQGQYVKYDELGGIGEELNFFLRASSKVLLLSDQKSINSKISQSMKELEERHESFLGSGSGWVLNQVLAANVEIGRLSLAGGCSNIKYDVKPVKKKYLVDAQTTGKECFFNSVALAFFPKDVLRSDSVQLGVLAREYTRINFKTKGLRLPVNLKDIKKFEQKNKALNIQINVFTILDGLMLPVHKSLSRAGTKVINLFLQQKRNGSKHHYIFISNLNKFLRSEDSKNYHCPLCLNSFSSRDAVQNHYSVCLREDPVRVEYPPEDSHEYFKNYDRQVCQPIFGCCDFEASMIPITRQENSLRYNCKNCEDEGDIEYCKHNTTSLHHQVPTTYSISLVDVYGKLIFEKTESDHFNVMEKFFTTLDYLETNYIPLLQRHRKKEDYTIEEMEHFNNSTVCHLCKLKFNPHYKGRVKVRDHCHYSNDYLGAAHKSCNWKRTVDRHLPIFIHNLKNYDSQFILQGLKYGKEKEVSGIPYNMEKFRTLNVGKIVFIDSFQILPSSLDSLVNDLRDSDHSFPILDQIPRFSGEHKDMLLKKGVYPYEWAQSISKLQKNKVFPKRSAFFSSLSQKHISKVDYKHGKRVFSKFQCTDMLDYCHLYCRLDTILLIEVMTKFRTGIFSDFKLDCTKYISTPQLGYDCMLLTLPYPVELMTDPDMILMMEGNVRGGHACVINREVHLPDYFETEPGQHVDDKIQDQLLYIDANNLYSVAQSSPMPVGSYAWCTADELSHIQEHISTIPYDYDQGFILEVDLIIPPHKHKDFASFPLLPYQKDMTFEDLSPFSQKSLITLHTKRKAKLYRSKKLVADVHDKNKYVLHYRNLQTCIAQGIVLTKIHRGIKFTQRNYLKKFIDICTEKRKNAKCSFDKMLYKLIMNSCYGKFLQNNRHHLEVRVCTNPKNFAKYFNSPLYKGHRILSENVVAVYLRKGMVILDRLYATGFSILEISKNHMYNSWYNYIQPSLGKENVSVVLTDTDSLLIKVTGKSRNQMLDQLDKCMDFSNYPQDHPRYTEKNKAVPGFFKDESAGNYMTEVIGLKAKCYITRVINQDRSVHKEHVVCKGITKAAREQLTLQTFRNVVRNIQTVHSDLYVIRTKNHQLYTQKLKKVALSTTDDKRYLKDCGIHTLPYGSVEPIECRICHFP